MSRYHDMLLGFGFCLLAFYSLNLVSSLYALERQENRRDFGDVQVVTYGVGLTGFFSAESGTFYLYDANLEECLMARKIVKLGDPLVDGK